MKWQYKGIATYVFICFPSTKTTQKKHRNIISKQEICLHTQSSVISDSSMVVMEKQTVKITKHKT